MKPKRVLCCLFVLVLGLFAEQARSFCASAHIVKKFCHHLEFLGSGGLERERKFYQGGGR